MAFDFSHTQRVTERIGTPKVKTIFKSLVKKSAMDPTIQTTKISKGSGKSGDVDSIDSSCGQIHIGLYR